MPATNAGRPSTPNEQHFHPGDKVEVKISELGFGGVWFEAVVIGAGPQPGSVVVRYDHRLKFWRCYGFMSKAVDISCVRPRPKPRLEVFCPGEAVEVSLYKGWQAANFAERLGWLKYAVVFPNGLRQEVFNKRLRRRLDWVDGEWVAPARPSVLLFNSETLGSLFPVGTSKPSEPTCHFIRKRERSPCRSTKKSKLKVYSSRKGAEKIEAEMESRIHESNSANKDNGEPAENKENISVSSNGIPGELALENDAMWLDKHVVSHSYHDLAIKSASGTITTPNLSKSVSDQFNTDQLTIIGVPMAQACMQYSSAKMASVWHSLLSLDIFQAMPQCPHFCSLEQMEDDSREGIALGHMVNFAKLAYSVPTLGLDVSIGALAKRLAALEDFERHGFNVEILRRRLETLIGLKRILDDVTQEKALLEAENTHNSKKCSELAYVIDVINNILKELEGIKTEATDTKEKCELMKTELEKKIQMLQDKSNALRKSFTSDWNFEK